MVLGNWQLILIWITVGQGPTVLAVGADGSYWILFSPPIMSLFFLPLSGPKSSVTGLITLLTDVIAYHGLQQSKEQSFIFILISGKWWKHAIWFSYKLRYRPYIWHWPIFTIFVFLLPCFMLHISSITYRRILKFSGLLSVAFCGTLHKNQRLLSIICDAKYWYMKYGEIRSHVIFKDPLCLHFWDLSEILIENTLSWSTAVQICFRIWNIIRLWSFWT